MTAPTDAPLHCPHFGRCGGCTRLDQPIADQLADKQTKARELLAPFLDGVEPAIALPPRTPRHDRTAILYPAQLRKGQLELGIYRQGSHDIEPIVDCRVQHKALTQLGVRLGEALRALNLPVYIEATGRGLVRGIKARVMPGSNELLAGVIVTRADFSERAALTKAMAAAMAGLRDDQGRPLQPVGAVVNVNDQPGNAMLGPVTIALSGRAWQTDMQRGLRFRVSFGSFYQLHRHAEAVLFAPALGLLGDVQGLRVVDGYGGVGTFGLRLLRAGAGRVTIVESGSSSCDDARANLADNGFADRAEVREELFGASPLPDCDLLVVDPPRAGLQAQGAAAVLASAPPRVLLVSCALEALARDLQALATRYRVQELRLCDLFPHTEHVEAVTLLVRR